MYDLNDTVTLKITTAKYYLPSGRLIQKQDYLNNGFLTDGLDKKDSTFYTKGGRAVKGGGGITPDIITLPNKISPYIQALWKNNVFFSFAASYTPFHEEIDIPVEINPSILNDFKLFLNDYDLSYQLEGEKEFKILSSVLRKAPISINQYSKNISMNYKSNKSYLNDMETYFRQLKIVQFSLPENQKWIKNGLAREISRVIGNEEERIKVSLLEDSEYKRAVNIILDLKEYYLTLEQNY
jgi:carboxyl-terminal processing protease